MKFSAPRETLLTPLQQVVGAVERRQTSPVLGNVLIEAESDTLTLTATDADIELQASGQLYVEQSGSVTVPARKLLDIWRHLPDGGRVVFEASGDKVRFNSGRSRFTLSTLPADQFPKVQSLDEPQRVTLLAGELQQCIRSTAFSMAQQDVRFYLNGLLLEIGSHRLSCVATDGHRLAYSECVTEAEPEQAVRAIIPRKSVAELQKLLGAAAAEDVVQVLVNAQFFQLQMGDVRLTTKLIDGRFPDYKRVIPIDGDKEFLIDVDTLKQSLTRASVLSSEKYRGVRICLSSGLLTISTENPEQEEAIDDVEVDFSGDTAEIGFNVTYLLDILNTVSTDNVRIIMKDGNSSALITPEATRDTQYVVMPMRL